MRDLIRRSDVAGEVEGLKARLGTNPFIPKEEKTKIGWLLDQIITMIFAAKTHDIPPTPVATWLKAEDGEGFECPLCRAEYYTPFKYCPSCGTKMDEEKE